jgi:ribosomal protein L29
MKRNDIKALHTLTREELDKKLSELQKEFAKVRLDHKVGRLKNVRITGTLRDDMARVATVLGMKASSVVIEEK